MTKGVTISNVTDEHFYSDQKTLCCMVVSCHDGLLKPVLI